jgi:hypothetical protein
MATAPIATAPMATAPGAAADPIGDILGRGPRKAKTASAAIAPFVAYAFDTSVAGCNAPDVFGVTLRSAL